MKTKNVFISGMEESVNNLCGFPITKVLDVATTHIAQKIKDVIDNIGDGPGGPGASGDLVLAE